MQNEEDERKDMENKNGKKKKRVCVMGAGASGLVTLKELMVEGHDAILFEATEFLGGAFSTGGEQSPANRSYASMYLTISNNYMAFSDFPPKDGWKFWTGTEYASYLEDYARSHGLSSQIRFQTRVIKVERDGGGGGGTPSSWRVTTTHPERGEEQHLFDSVAVSIGSHQHPNIPTNIEGLENFTGSVDHSYNFYQDTSKWRGKRVVVVGIGESSSDIVREISDISKECTLVVRKVCVCGGGCFWFVCVFSVFTLSPNSILSAFHAFWQMDIQTMHLLDASFIQTRMTLFGCGAGHRSFSYLFGFPSPLRDGDGLCSNGEELTLQTSQQRLAWASIERSTIGWTNECCDLAPLWNSLQSGTSAKGAAGLTRASQKTLHLSPMC